MDIFEKVILNSSKGKLKNNNNTNIKSAIFNDSRLLPLDRTAKVLDEYQQYLKEKADSKKYRLTFSINPICSNVLFNNVSEIVYKEGSDECINFKKSGISRYDFNVLSKNEEFSAYYKMKFGENDKKDGTRLTRHELIKDTSYSHPRILGATYHNGFDIFNNHYLRQIDSCNINPCLTSNTENFNTLFDYLRYDNGKIVEDFIDDLSHDVERDTTKIHRYQIDDVYTFEESINENLLEKDGWIGFTNNTVVNIPNYKCKNGDMLTLNKCMNNREACDFIDMYPDRSLFSFTPNINKYRGNRAERNWDYCITYPYSNWYDNDLVTFKCDDFSVNGLKCHILGDDFFEVIEENGKEIFVVKEQYSEGSIITLKSVIKNNFKKGSTIDIVLIGEINGKIDNIRLPYLETVRNVGYNGTGKEYFFSIYADQLFEYIDKFDNLPEIRIRKSVYGELCKYYFRNFKKLPNMNNSSIRPEDIINNKTDDGVNFTFNSSVNNLGFSRNIYTDSITQLLFNDDINLNGLKDNLGRDISELFLTIVKNNDGNKEWYDDKDYRNSAITFSRCFSRVTSGIDIINNDGLSDYNIHSLHNISVELYGKYKNLYDHIFITENDEPRAPKALEYDININGTDNNNLFLGDIVEFNVSAIEEVVLEDVLHRFNTRQREYYAENDFEYSDIRKDEIFRDDYDLKIEGYDSGYISYEDMVRTKDGKKDERGYLYNAYYSIDDYLTMNESSYIPINIAPEGYYYKPHYSLKLREFKTKVNNGSHTLVVINGDTFNDDNTWSFTTSKNYYLEVNKDLFLYHRLTNDKKIAKIQYVGGKHFTEIKVHVKLEDGENIKDYVIFKPNSEKPINSYDLNDGTGRYLWRDELEDNEYDRNGDIYNYVFTNGAHYINKDIVFFLRRQDPSGKSISNENCNNDFIQNVTIAGNNSDYSNEEYINEENSSTC